MVRGHNGIGQTPHINLWIVAGGINIKLNIRLYFDDNANSADPGLALIEQAHCRRTLIARRRLRGGKPLYRFDICLQGDGETVFLDI